MANINEEFISCVKTCNINAVTTLLESGVDVHYKNNYALRWSAKNGDLDMVVKLLESNADPNADYVLRHSIDSDCLDIVIKLLEFGADVNAHNDYLGCFSELEASVNRNNLDMVVKLLEYGADVHSGNGYALRLSITRNHFEIATTLLENGANVHCNDACILKNLLINFNEKTADVVIRNVPFLPPSLIHETKVSLLRLVLPYCDTNDYEYFPVDYIRSRLIPIKSANSA